MKTNEKIMYDLNVTLSAAKSKFPTWPKDPMHALAIIGEEFGELQQSVTQFIYEKHKGITRQDIRTEALQTMAMCSRFLQALDENEFLFGPTEQYEQTH